MVKLSSEDRLREKVKTLCILLLLGTVAFISLVIVLLPAVHTGYRVPEGALIAVLASLSTSALGLAGVRVKKE